MIHGITVFNQATTQSFSVSMRLLLMMIRSLADGQNELPTADAVGRQSLRLPPPENLMVSTDDAVGRQALRLSLPCTLMDCSNLGDD